MDAFKITNNMKFSSDKLTLVVVFAIVLSASSATVLHGDEHGIDWNALEHHSNLNAPGRLENRLRLIRLINLLHELDLNANNAKNPLEDLQFYQVLPSDAAVGNGDSLEDTTSDDASFKMNDESSAIIKKITPENGRNKRVLNLKRDCHLGLGMGYLCHAYSITKFSQHQKLMNDPQGPGK